MRGCINVLFDNEVRVSDPILSLIKAEPLYLKVEVNRLPAKKHKTPKEGNGLKMQYVKSRYSYVVIVMILICLTFVLPRAQAWSAPESPPLPAPTERLDLPYFQLSEQAVATDASWLAASSTVEAWERLVYQSYRDGNWEIYIMDGSVYNERRLTAHPAADIHPRLSPDANRVVFASKRTGNYEIYVMNINGSGLTQLTFNSKDDGNPAWSPDGTKIAFEAYRDGQAEIYVMNADGSNQTRLTANAAYDGEPTWSPDGKRIAFTSKRTGLSRIWIMQADGSGLTQLPVGWYGSSPSWSPSGAKIAYTGDPDGDGWFEACQADLDGSNSYCVYNPSGQTDAWVRGWSPDGEYIVFTTISFIYYYGNWYWTEAFIEIAPVEWPNPPIRLSRSGVDWNPDWRSTDRLAPRATMQSLPAYTRAPDVNVSWSGVDLGPSGIRKYDVQYRLDGSPWTDWLMGTQQTNATYSGVGGQEASFRVRAWDNASNVSQWTPEVSVAHTQFYSRTLAGQIYDTRGVAVVDATVIVTPTTLSAITVDDGGQFFAYMAHNGETQVQIAAPGSAPFLRTESDAAHDLLVEVWLLPEVNLIQNGGFELDDTLLSSWQSGGDSAPAVTTYTRQNGLNAVNFNIDHIIHEMTTTREKLSPPEDTLIHWYNPAIWVDLQGIVHLVVWEEYPSREIVYLTRDLNGDWSEPISLGGIGEWHYGSDPSVTVTPQQMVHVIWQGEEGIYYNHTLPDGSWNGQQLLLPRTTVYVYGYAKIASDDKGTLHIVYTDGTTLYHLYRRLQGAWSKASLVGSGNWANITFGPDYSVHIWSGSQYRQRLPSGQWLPVETVPCGDQIIEQAIVDQEGTVHALCGHYAGDGGYLYRLHGSSWSEKSPLPHYEGGTGSIALDSRGTLYVATTTTNYNYYSAVDLYSRYRPYNEDWSEPTLLVAASKGATNIMPIIGIGGSDRPHLVYIDSSTLEVYYQTSASFASQSNTAVLSQTVTVPMDMINPTLSFFYNMYGASPQNPEAFTISVVDNLTSTVIFSTTNNTNWRHQWLDLSPWTGKTVTLVFASKTLAGDSYVNLYLDDITLGGYYPDLWIATEDMVAVPGQEVTYRLTYGNQSGAAVDNVKIVTPLSPALIFESADPAPTFNTIFLQQEWDLGTLPANSGPYAIVITATVAPSVTWFSTYVHTATISSPVTEANLSNNTAYGALLIANRIYLPLVMRSYFN